MILLLVACGSSGRDCVPFAEMAVTDPDGLASIEELASAERVLEQFAYTTGRGGVCVPEIRFVASEIDGEANGSFRGAGEPIRIVAGTSDVERTTRHELCHALTEQERWHESRPDLFLADSVEDYPWDDLRAHEAFARACDVDPADLAVGELAGSCGWSPLSNRDAFLLGAIYPGARDWAGTDRRVPVDLETRAVYVAGADVDIEAVEGTSTEALVVTVDRKGVSTLRHVDPRSGRETGSVNLPGNSWAGWSLINGEGVVIAAQKGTGAWRVEGEPLPLPDFPLGTSDTPRGVVADGRVWVAPGGHTSSDAMSVYHLTDGAVSSVAWPGGGERVAPWWSASGNRVYTLAEGELLAYDLVSASWSVYPSARPYLQRGLGYGDDGWAAALASPIDTPMLGVWDEASEEWAYPQDPCGAALGSDATLITIGGDVWVWQPGTSEGRWTIARVVIRE